MSQSEDPKNAVPQHLRPTYDLLDSTFPGGVPERFYLPLSMCSTKRCRTERFLEPSLSFPPKNIQRFTTIFLSSTYTFEAESNLQTRSWKRSQR